MNLKNKKALAARTLGVGKEMIAFNPARLQEIGEAITKQDIRDLISDGAILIKQTVGKRKSKPGSRRRGYGKVRKKIKTRKRDYMNLTRKLREYLKQLKFQEKVTNEEYKKIRGKIKSKQFRSKIHFKETHKQTK